MKSQKPISLLILIPLVVSQVAAASELRYVVDTKTAGTTLDEYPLWTNRQFAESCSRATIEGTRLDQRATCENGILPGGFRPKKGNVTAGKAVELLDSRECGSMAFVRVLTGGLTGETGCITAAALSSTNPSE
jgi:hypothetical protein